mgnify:CR=1 FL=1
MKQAIVFITALVIMLVLAVAYRSYRAVACNSRAEQVTSKLDFRDKQCVLAGHKKECYTTNVRLAEKEVDNLVKEGCLR